MALRVPGTASGLPLIMDGLLMQSASAETTAELPAHLGWGSAAQTAARLAAMWYSPLMSIAFSLRITTAVQRS